jgi:hypothetical protein
LTQVGAPRDLGTRPAMAAGVTERPREGRWRTVFPRRCRRALRGYIPRWADRRLRRSDCCEPCCCRFSIRCGASGCWWSNQLQPVVPVVRGHGHGRGSVEPRRLQQEPGAGTERRSGRGFLAASAAAGATVRVGRAYDETSWTLRLVP